MDLGTDRQTHRQPEGMIIKGHTFRHIADRQTDRRQEGRRADAQVERHEGRQEEQQTDR
jgi:hypothetical protein